MQDRTEEPTTPANASTTADTPPISPTPGEIPATAGPAATDGTLVETVVSEAPPTKRIRFTSNDARGPLGKAHYAGDEVALDPAKAEEIVASGAAEYVT